ncbi:uncharacterized protein LOC134454432 [Engraulis encrasicolus]|uniref:uncharacterized protein LOC134454432 n=1 Tax=Engraulis encrasicolus TaxID=184585 RepID=UPI002FD13683
MANDDASRMLMQSTEVKEDHHNLKDAREEQRTAALQGLESASVPLLTTNQMEAPQVTPLEEHRHTELQPEPEALSSAPTLPSTITVPATKATDVRELSINDHTNTAASMTTDPSRGEIPSGQQEVEDDAVMSRAVSEGFVSPPDIKSPDRDAMPVNEPHRDTVAPLNDHNRGSVAPSMDHKRYTAGSGSSSHPRPDVAAAHPVEDTSNSSGMQESSVTSEGRGHDPERALQVSAELRCHHDDPFDPCDASSFNMVSDSQLNDLISVMEMEDQRGPESFGAAEDATELVCGLITELSSLNRSIMAAHRELESLRRGNRTARTPQRRPFAQRRPDATPPSSS